ncbi:MAG: Putative monooxygenase [uncultured Thermomicrobiales bacterium]|uniref:Monooxygenase n=1 Tax=uncultured Thermomicrobiales bacterium TaxID=1645740 RepID=A0A6J4VGQ0_9BACT|nr:MAG: Putative monooxygenase [uncultured Thermomicrobiales bacterium]
MAPAETIETVVIGAGHAGLAMSYELSRRGVPHAVLERGRVGETWRARRWDAFWLIMPNWGLDLPGFPYQGDRDAFTDRDGFVAYLERYAARFGAPVRPGVDVTALDPAPDGGFVLATSAGPLRAASVVVATSIYHAARRPTFAANLPPDILQLDPDTYRNTQSLPPGAVLVVGTGQSGAQIAEDLVLGGRRVYLAVGRTGRVPRRYRGTDSSWWFAIGRFHGPDGEKLGGDAHRSGRDGGRDLNLHRFARDGVTLLGRVTGARGHLLDLADDLHANLAYADAYAAAFRAGVDGYIAERGLDAPPPDPSPDEALADGFALSAPPELDLRAAGITTVVWATGYGVDFSWVHAPVIDEDGHLAHDRGVTAVPGLYCVGMTFREDPKSTFIRVVGWEAERVADHIAARAGAGTADGAPEGTLAAAG